MIIANALLLKENRALFHIIFPVNNLQTSIHYVAKCSIKITIPLGQKTIEVIDSLKAAQRR